MEENEREISPTVTEPEPKVNEPQTNPELAQLLKTLESLGVDSPEKVQNLATAASQTGHMANLLGELRRSNEELKTELSQARVSRPTNASYDEIYGSPATPNVDIETAVERAIGRYMDGQMKNQMRAQQQVLSEISSIQNDPDYAFVEEQWNKVYNDPVIRTKVIAGETTPMVEYNRLKNNFFRNALIKMRDVLKSGGSLPGTTKPPHVETNMPNLLPSRQTGVTQKERLREVSKQATGSDDDIMKMLDALLPKDDPFLRPG